MFFSNFTEVLSGYLVGYLGFISRSSRNHAEVIPYPGSPYIYSVYIRVILNPP